MTNHTTKSHFEIRNIKSKKALMVVFENGEDESYNFEEFGQYIYRATTIEAAHIALHRPCYDFENGTSDFPNNCFLNKKDYEIVQVRSNAFVQLPLKNIVFFNDFMLNTDGNLWLDANKNNKNNTVHMHKVPQETVKVCLVPADAGIDLNGLLEHLGKRIILSHPTSTMILLDAFETEWDMVQYVCVFFGETL